MSCLRLRDLCNQDRACRSLILTGPDMAKIIAAYIAHGRIHSGRFPPDRIFPRGSDLQLRWQQIYCLFALLKKFSTADEHVRFLLFSDHAPPVIYDRLLGRHLERLGVEIHRIDHLWRSDSRSDSHEYFLFDSMEQLAQKTVIGDQILIFGSQALAVHPLGPVFDLLSTNDILVAEASIGEVNEDHARAMRDRMMDLRKTLSIPFPTDAMLAIQPDFVGVTHDRLIRLMSRLKTLFPRNLSLISSGRDHFLTAGELFAAMLAQDDIHRSTLGDISLHAAAMPDDFVIARLADAAIFLPGYGLQPDIPELFFSLLPDRLLSSQSLSLNSVMRILKREQLSKSFLHSVRSWAPFARNVSP